MAMSLGEARALIDNLVGQELLHGTSRRICEHLQTISQSARSSDQAEHGSQNLRAQERRRCASLFGAIEHPVAQLL